jgi:hypothetical protein
VLLVEELRFAGRFNGRQPGGRGGDSAPLPELDQAQQAALIKKSMDLAPKYPTELLKNA